MFIAYIFWSVLYSVFSYALTDPNLVLLQFDGYQQFQMYMWQTFFENPQLLTVSYVLLVVVGFVLYFLLYNKLKKSRITSITQVVEECALHRTSQFSIKHIFSGIYAKPLVLFALLLVPLFFAYNALSHDVFNYMFNSKMVIEYQANPHQQVALDFSEDPWTRFMHNTHTPAPYGYGWTGVSVIPYLMGFGKFITTWLSFRFFSVVSLVLLYVAIQYFSVEMRRKYMALDELFLVFANPLILIEVVANSHNDLWMMAPAVASFGLLFSVLRKKHVPTQQLTWSALLLFFSITIKFATAVLLVPWLFLVLLHAGKLFSLEKIAERVSWPFVVTGLNVLSNVVLEKVFAMVPFVASVLLFLPLLTSRSQQFHPWYLLWVLVWVPFITNKIWKFVLLAFSVSSLLRYVPWLYAGGFEGDVLTQQKLITWFSVVIALVGYYAVTYRKSPPWWK